MTGIATLVTERLPGFNGRASLYKLDPPLDGVHTFVVAYAAAVPYSGPETYLFPSDETGHITDWGELDGSYRGGLDHGEALRGAGYEVAAS